MITENGSLNNGWNIRSGINPAKKRMNIAQVLKHIHLLDELAKKGKRKTARKNTTPETSSAKKTLLETYRDVARRKR